MSVTNICHSGDHVVCASAIYGGTFNLFNKTLRELGIDFTFLPPEARRSRSTPRSRRIPAVCLSRAFPIPLWWWRISALC